MAGNKPFPGAVTWVREGENAKIAAVKGSGKPRWSTMPVRSLEGVVRAFEEGVDKYGKFNWRHGVDADFYYDAAMRHLSAWSDGETLDPESPGASLHHIDKAIANLLILRDAEIHGALKEPDKSID